MQISQQFQSHRGAGSQAASVSDVRRARRSAGDAGLDSANSMDVGAGSLPSFNRVGSHSQPPPSVGTVGRQTMPPAGLSRDEDPTEKRDAIAAVMLEWSAKGGKCCLLILRNVKYGLQGKTEVNCCARKNHLVACLRNKKWPCVHAFVLNATGHWKSKIIEAHGQEYAAADYLR